MTLPRNTDGLRRARAYRSKSTNGNGPTPISKPYSNRWNATAWTSGGSTGSSGKSRNTPPDCRTPSGSTTPSSTMRSVRTPDCAPSSTTAGAGWAATAIRWHFRATPTPHGPCSPTCPTSRLRLRTSTTAGGATTSAATCSTRRRRRPIRNFTRAGCNTASSPRSSKPIRPKTRASNAASGASPTICSSCATPSACATRWHPIFIMRPARITTRASACAARCTTTIPNRTRRTRRPNSSCSATTFSPRPSPSRWTA